MGDLLICSSQSLDVARYCQATIPFLVIYDFTAGSPRAVPPGGSGASAASAAVRSFNPRHAVPGRAAAPANRIVCGASGIPVNEYRMVGTAVGGCIPSIAGA